MYNKRTNNPMVSDTNEILIIMARKTSPSEITVVYLRLASYPVKSSMH